MNYEMHTTARDLSVQLIDCVLEDQMPNVLTSCAPKRLLYEASRALDYLSGELMSYEVRQILYVTALCSEMQKRTAIEYRVSRGTSVRFPEEQALARLRQGDAARLSRIERRARGLKY